MFIETEVRHCEERSTRKSIEAERDNPEGLFLFLMNCFVPRSDVVGLFNTINSQYYPKIKYYYHEK